MAKKYHQTRKDREDESRGMKRAMRDHRNFVTGHDPEIGRDDYAGLPSEKVMAKYPPNRMRRGGYLDDSMSEIDAIQMDSDHVIESHLSHQK